MLKFRAQDPRKSLIHFGPSSAEAVEGRQLPRELDVRRAIWSVLGVAGLIAAAVFLSRSASRPIQTSVGASNGTSKVTPDDVLPAEQPDSPEAPGNLVSIPEIPREALSIPVTLPNGRPAAGAALSWSPVTPLLLSTHWDWDEVDIAWWNQATIFATADREGWADADAPRNEAGLGSVVWTDLPGFEAQFDLLAPEVTSLAGHQFQFVERTAVRVNVLDASGVSVIGAVVEQHGVALRDSLDAPLYVPLLFHRTRVTDAEGCLASRFPGRQAIVARLGSSISRPVILDEDSNTVTLRVFESFTVAGTITRPTSLDLVGEIIPRVTVSAQHDNLWRELGTAVPKGEAWGPLTLPCLVGEQYRAEVHGVGVVPSEFLFPAPTPGEKVVLNLEAQAGLGQWFIAYNEEGLPLPEAQVAVGWEESGVWYWVSGNARPDGFISVLGIRPGVVKAIASCPGYASSAFPLQELPLPAPLTLSAILTRGTTMSGRVLQHGLPAPDFEITYWPSDDLDLRRSKVYLDQEDGEFLIDDAFIEPMGIVAAAPGAPGSEPLQIEVTKEGIHGLELILVDAVFGEGVVVQKSNGQPLPEATVQAYVLGGGGPVSPWGHPVRVQANGHFNLEAFREGENWLVATAPGYGARPVFAKSEGRHVDFGVIPLERAVDLRVEIEGASDQGIYRLETRSVISLGTSTFDPDQQGNLVGWLRGVGLGFHEFRLLYPDGAEAHLSLDVTEKTEVLRFPGGSGALVVEVQEGSEPDALNLYVEQDVENVKTFQRIVSFEPKGRAQIAGLRPGPTRLYLRVLDRTLASTSTTILDGETTLVTMSIGEGALLVRAVDTEDEPVSGATVRLFGTEAVRESHGGLTDEKGELLLRGLNFGQYVLHVNHPSLGLLPDEEITIGTDEHIEREVVLDGRASLQLLLIDDDIPLPGLTCRLLDRAGRNLCSSVLTNEEGRAAIPRLAPGSYRLSVTGSSIWKVDTTIDVQPGAGLRTLEVRRLGDLKLRALNPEGVPVQGVDVALVDLATDESVQDWIAAGRVEAPGGLATDKHGEVLLSGLPHGSYSWECGASKGTLQVAPGEESLALISLQ